VKNRWNETEAAGFEGALGPCVYGSRLLGSEPSLVLHGGGNSSIKHTEQNVSGEDMDVLWVKGSGWDLAEMTSDGFAPLRLDAIRRLADLDSLSDTDMANELRIAMLDASAPNPSVEAIVHAIIPATAVMHTHSDALLAISNTSDGSARIRAIYGERVVVVPYARSGFRVGRAAAVELARQLTDETVGIVRPERRTTA